MSNLERYIDRQLGALTDERDRLAAENASLREQGRLVEAQRDEAWQILNDIYNARRAAGLDDVEPWDSFARRLQGMAYPTPLQRTHHEQS